MQLTTQAHHDDQERLLKLTSALFVVIDILFFIIISIIPSEGNKEVMIVLTCVSARNC